MPDSSRREFVAKAAAIGAPAVRTAWGQSSPNSEVRLGVVGFRSRGRDHYRTFAKIPGVKVAFLCDIDERLFPGAIKEIEEIGGNRPETFTDLQKMLQRKDLDAISVATPDHWHALMTIWGCQAGKDVYCEKPVCHNIKEGRKMVEAARKYGRMVQTGLNRRSEMRNQAGVKFVREASFGKAYRAKAVVYRGRVSMGRVQESSIPQGVNWDRFLGPAPYRAFNLNRFHYAWHYYWDTATTEVGNNGVHAIDIVRWALNKNVHPVKIHCAGGRFADDNTDQETPNLQNAVFEYADGTLVDLEVTTLPSPAFGGVHMGEFFYTPNGYITTAKDWTTVKGEFTPQTTPDPPSGISLRAANLSFPNIKYVDGPAIPDISVPVVSHFQNFIDCVRSRKRENLNCEVLEGHMSTALCHLANIAFRTGRKLTFDPATETFPGDAEANALLGRKYREPYVLPENV
ncbi:MAG TPA: Gfo/Idh/MocA family oxidoreductase [Bryobacteraceae bacterium]|nr:Gfo/Idh/MocA family oxidoreductase [Bryobacteraceae bacterium]HPT26982.1 Gfo/Idh/MocA family oxidoreductase [Bryobacteraceae bacterium]